MNPSEYFDGRDPSEGERHRVAESMLEMINNCGSGFRRLTRDDASAIVDIIMGQRPFTAPIRHHISEK